ncbi:MAG: phosphatidylinositol-3-phosphatase [Actinomycetota bacterium]|jgi:phospholipase C|nr:phosphatidylinositol-3-phosphatase [Actinomycetota bacterium]
MPTIMLMTGRRLLVALLGLALLASGCSGSGRGTAADRSGRSGRSQALSADATSTNDTVGSPCGWQGTAPAHYQHVIWVVFENHSYGDLIGPVGSTEQQRAPYLNWLARHCGLATDYHSVTHPSLPNYLAMVSGGTGGLRTDCLPSACPQDLRTVFDQLQAHSRSWRVYAESMPAACTKTDAGPYVARHNAPTYFPARTTACRARDLPMGSLSAGHLVDDVRAGSLRALSLVIPNQCHNTHDCSIATGDRWLSKAMQLILGGADYREGGTAVFVTYDEGAGGYSGQSCSTDPDRSCHVVTLVVSPTTTPGTRSSTRFDHYALLETTEHLFGFTTLLRHAGDLSTHSMRSAFGL